MIILKVVYMPFGEILAARDCGLELLQVILIEHFVK